MTPEMFTDNLGEVSRRQAELVDGLRAMLGLAAKVTLVPPSPSSAARARPSGSSTAASSKEEEST